MKKKICYIHLRIENRIDRTGRNERRVNVRISSDTGSLSIPVLLLENPVLLKWSPVTIRHADIRNRYFLTVDIGQDVSYIFTLIESHVLNIKFYNEKKKGRSSCSLYTVRLVNFVSFEKKKKWP